MNNEKHVVTIPMKDYLELTHIDKNAQEANGVLNNALVQLYEEIYANVDKIPNRTITKSFMFDRRVGNDGKITVTYYPKR